MRKWRRERERERLSEVRRQNGGIYGIEDDRSEKRREERRR